MWRSKGSAEGEGGPWQRCIDGDPEARNNGGVEFATYTYAGEMPDMMKPGSMVAFREVVRVVDADHMVMEIYESRGGKDVRTMQIDDARAR